MVDEFGRAGLTHDQSSQFLQTVSISCSRNLRRDHLYERVVINGYDIISVWDLHVIGGTTTYERTPKESPYSRTLVLCSTACRRISKRVDLLIYILVTYSLHKR